MSAVNGAGEDKIMSSYKELHKRAERLGLSLWQNGGYYYLSGFIRGKHRQGSFDTLRSVEAQLSDEARYQKAMRM